MTQVKKRGDPVIARRIREARERIGFTQDQLAERSGIARSTIATIETAHRPIGLENLLILAEFFGVPVDYFTSRDESMAAAQWILGRLPKDEREAWVKLMAARLGVRGNAAG